MRKRFIAGNWKMYKFISSSMEFADEFKELYIPNDNTTVALICPYLQIPALKYALQDTSIFVGAQNMHYETEGAFTGEISGEMLKEVGTDFVIIGHSERRQYFGETDEAVNAKIKKALMLEIYPILCVGESLEQREVGLEKITVKEELEKDLAGLTPEQMLTVTIAYEPIWAIGTGKTATAEQAEEMCAFIRSVVADLFGQETADEVIIQYGGSVKPGNAKEILDMPDIDGALVGGASLVAQDFWDIVNA